MRSAAAVPSTSNITEKGHAMTGSEGASCALDIPRAERIARLNDNLRKTGTGGLITITRAVTQLPGFDAFKLLVALAAFDSFDVDNDPHGERDFGDVEFAGHGLLWTIGYYDLDMRYASPDPADPAVTQRVLSVMLPEDY